MSALSSREEAALVALTEATFASSRPAIPARLFLDHCRRYLASVNPAARLALRAAIALVEYGPWITTRAASPFHRLPRAVRSRLAERAEESRWYPLRAAFLAVKSLCGLAYCSIDVRP